MMSTLMRRNPFAAARRLVEAMKQRFDARSRTAGGGSSVTDSPEGWRLRIPLPGIPPDAIDVTVAGRILQVRADETDHDTRLTRYEEMVALPADVDIDRIAARYRHGMLELTLPAKEDMAPRRIEVSTTESPQLATAA